MRAIDAVERLVSESEVSVAVLGAGRDFMLIRLDGDGELDPIELAEARSRGYTYAGVLSINRDGQPGAEYVVNAGRRCHDDARGSCFRTTGICAAEAAR